ncbi:MAG TPA: TetR/AcrR family transcriptional regulator [Phaeodactylibacter sp.]|nr:TetR/AcrR family transcriptional regulator [Phaeodactylibacter sp.]
MDKSDTRQRIIEAARRIFLQKGMAGTRMQEIADAAGINKAMLHYYFRSKEQLFKLVFAEAVKEIFPKVEKALAGDLPIREKLLAFVRAYISQIREHPFVPLFVIHELSNRPTEFFMEPEKSGAPQKMLQKLMQEIIHAQQRGEIPDYPPQHLWVNILALSIFPFIARPLIQQLLQMDDKAFERFLEERTAQVARFLDQALRIA